MLRIVKKGLNLGHQPAFLSSENADDLFKDVNNANFQRQEITVGGRKFTPSRELYAEGDPGLAYNFSGTSLYARPWSPNILKLKGILEAKLESAFNFISFNRYPDGTSKLGQHRDNEADMDPTAPIAIISLGATRTMRFCGKEFNSMDLPLNHGSLLVMYPPTNANVTHGILEDPECIEPRISLTFRKIKEGPPRKRAKLDWLDYHFQAQNVMEPQNIFIHNSLYFQITEFNSSLLLHLRLFEGKEMPEWPSKHGITFSAAEFFYLQRKLNSLSLIKPENFMTNMILCIFQEEEIHLQTLKIVDERLHLNTNVLKISYNNLEELCDRLPAIKKSLLNKMWTDYMPRKYSKIFDETTLNECEEPMREKMLVSVFEKHIEPFVKKFYNCNGCNLHAHNQKSHDCETLDLRWRYETLGDSLLFLINVDMFIEELASASVFPVDYLFKINLDVITENLFQECE